MKTLSIWLYRFFLPFLQRFSLKKSFRHLALVGNRCRGGRRPSSALTNIPLCSSQSSVLFPRAWALSTFHVLLCVSGHLFFFSFSPTLLFVNPFSSSRNSSCPTSFFSLLIIPLQLPLFVIILLSPSFFSSSSTSSLPKKHKKTTDLWFPLLLYLTGSFLCLLFSPRFQHLQEMSREL